MQERIEDLDVKTLIANMKGKYQACFMLVANDFTEKLVSWCLHIHSLSTFPLSEN